MKAFLLFKNRDFNPESTLTANWKALMQDLDLRTLFDAMSGDDELIFKVASSVLLAPESDIETILYRQSILADCLKNEPVVRSIYELAGETLTRERRECFRPLRDSPGSILYWSRATLEMFLEMLGRLRRIAEEHASGFESEGFTQLFATLRAELDDDFFAKAQHHMHQLKFRHGVLISAGLGQGNKGTDYILRKAPKQERRWLSRLFEKKPPQYSFQLHPRDENGARALSELRDRGLNLVANRLAQSNDHILSFFRMLRTELAFYVGCLNLRRQLAQKGEPTGFPFPAAAGERRLSCHGLYDVCLSLRVKQRLVGNGMKGDGKDCVIITGANQGGKSTFLRALGIAQLMMQSGMFVPAVSFSANICNGVFTHFKREEDAAMKSGKLDEELRRMSAIVDQVKPHSMVLFNESFAATNEREGSEIARQIVTALLERKVKIAFVTHLYDLAHSLRKKSTINATFLRAERQDDGRRTFKIREGDPLETSFGKDLYRSIFAGEENALVD
jgi:DNA mismatch repair ATPase MutS